MAAPVETVVSKYPVTPLSPAGNCMAAAGRGVDRAAAASRPANTVPAKADHRNPALRTAVNCSRKPMRLSSRLARYPSAARSSAA